MTSPAEPHSSPATDIVVVGAGPSGMACALMLARSGFKTALVAPAVNTEDGRTTALLDASVEMLKSIDLWHELEPHCAPLRHMRIIDATKRLIRAPEVVFDSMELKLAAFGYNIENRSLNEVLSQKCLAEPNLRRVSARLENLSLAADEAALRLDTGEIISAHFVVGADGRNSKVREAAGIESSQWRYPQQAVVLNLTHEHPHHNHSTEFHQTTGPFTLVPLPGKRSSLVCVVAPETANDLMALSDEELALEMERRAHSIYGKMSVSSPRQSFPLGGMSAKKLAANRCVLIGEAAHVFPPIGAQGLNLGLRDVAALANLLKPYTGRIEQLGEQTVPDAYERARRSDVMTRTMAVDLLNRSLLSELFPVQAFRSAGLYAAGKIPPLRRFLMREGVAPMLARSRHTQSLDQF